MTNNQKGSDAVKAMFGQLGDFARYLGSQVEKEEEANFGLWQVHGASAFLAGHLFKLPQKEFDQIVAVAEDAFASMGALPKEAVASYRIHRSGSNNQSSRPNCWQFMPDVKKMVN